MQKPNPRIDDIPKKITRHLKMTEMPKNIIYFLAL